METIKRRYTTVANWIEKVNNLCSFGCVFKIAVYNNLSFNINERIFEVVINDYKNIVLHFGEYFVFKISNDCYDETNTPCLKMLICKQRPDEKYYVEA